MRRTSQKSFQTHFSITIIKVTYFHLQQRVPKNLTSTSILGIYVKRKKKRWTIQILQKNIYKRRGILAMQLMVTFTAMVSITLQQIGKISY